MTAWGVSGPIQVLLGKPPTDQAEYQIIFELGNEWKATQKVLEFGALKTTLF